MKQTDKLHYGKGTYGNPAPIVRGDMSHIYIGNYTSIAQDVVLDAGFHHNTDSVSTFPFNAFFKELYAEKKYHINHPKTKGDIHIGSDVWLGEGCMIMGGVTIGDGAVVGARAVVTKNVEAYSVVGGVPAKHIKYRFDKATIKKLLKIKWWDWDEEKIKRAIPYLTTNDLKQFFRETDSI